jgi:hypothetical protein
VKRALDQAFVAVDGNPIRIKRGHEYADDDPAVLGYPDLFVDVPEPEPEPIRRGGRRAGS